MNQLSESNPLFEEGPKPEVLLQSDIDDMRKLVTDKLSHLPLGGNYREPITGRYANAVGSVIFGDENKFDDAEIVSPGYHSMTREAEFLLPDGNHLALKHTYHQSDELDPSSDEGRSEWIEAYYLTATSETDDKGRKMITEQKFDFSLPESGEDEVPPEELDFRIERTEFSPKGVLSSRLERDLKRHAEGLPSDDTYEKPEYRPYTRDEHNWLTEVIAEVQPDQQITSPQDCWLFL